MQDSTTETSGPKPAEAPTPTTKFDHLGGRGMHELRFDELPEYVLMLADCYPVGTCRPEAREALKAAVEWIVSELERKTNEERAAAVKLDELRSAQMAVVHGSAFDPEAPQLASRPLVGSTERLDRGAAPAAAPDLLGAATQAAEVMEKAKKLLRAAGFSMEEGTISKPYGEALDALRAALAAAEGKQP